MGREEEKKRDAVEKSLVGMMGNAEGCPMHGTAWSSAAHFWTERWDGAVSFPVLKSARSLDQDGRAQGPLWP